MKNVPNNFVEKMKAHVLCSITPLHPTSPPSQKMMLFFEIIRKSVTELDRPLVAVWQVQGNKRLQTHNHNM